MPPVLSGQTDTLCLPRKPRVRFYRHDFLRWTIAAIVSLTGYGTRLQLAPIPSTATGWPATRTVQGPTLREALNQRYKVRPVTVWTETNQIPSEAFRALNAMADTRFHGKNRKVRTLNKAHPQTRRHPVANSLSLPEPLESFPLQDQTISWISVKDKVVGSNSHLTRSRHNHYYPRL